MNLTYEIIILDPSFFYPQHFHFIEIELKGIENNIRTRNALETHTVI
jgi:hypothetical protein